MTVTVHLGENTTLALAAQRPDWVLMTDAEVVEADVPRITPPETITMRQARLALLGAGKLTTVDAAIAAMPGIEGEAARIEWEYAQEVRRDSPLIAALGPAIGLTESEIDGLFAAGASL